ncbi:MAG: hypothetical protein WC732_09985, partial [Candidatus Omnitrophota bacterium]
MINRPTDTIRSKQKKQAGLLALFFLLLPVACGLLPGEALAQYAGGSGSGYTTGESALGLMSSSS